MHRITTTASAGMLAGIAMLGTLAAAPAHAATGACADASVRSLIPASPPVASWAENVTYDDAGDLWVSRTLANVIDRYDTEGRRTATIHVTAPGAVRQGADGRMYAASGATPINLIPTLRRGTLVSFDPADPTGPVRTEVRGLGMPNGLAIADDGAMYVADSSLGVVRIGADKKIDRGWTARAPRNLAPTRTVNGTSMNGIVIIDDAAYVTMTSSLSGRILRVPLDRPEKTTAAVDLTEPLPGIVDDVTALDDRTIAAASTTGQVIIADLKTRDRCTISVGRPVTSLVERADGALVAGSETGEVVEITGVGRSVG
ncbi:SMP-30/gluconolactonase/LRE family protein [Gordonia zhaorongruii]|uniref:SMP-30/gluconolactonase/LRE family protein n=1 Tax=Gordonia zhaorongruii TaxID=2597659 RepID=UPI001F2A209A|nr:hypothetical protein [Gordonia zhaorongruii]